MSIRRRWDMSAVSPGQCRFPAVGNTSFWPSSWTIGYRSGRMGTAVVVVDRLSCRSARRRGSTGRDGRFAVDRGEYGGLTNVFV